MPIATTLTDRPVSETPETMTARLLHEAELIAQGRADVEAGSVVSSDEVDAWLDRWVEGKEPMSIPAESPRLTGPR